MVSTSKKYVLLVFVGMFCLRVDGSLEKCFKSDSISCIQIQIYDTLRNLFDKANLDISGVLTLSTSSENNDNSAGTTNGAEEKIIGAVGVEQRQILLERYFQAKLKHLWGRVSVTWNAIGILRSILAFLPQDVLQNVAEGRAKETKSIKMLLPLLIAVKLKLAAFAAVAYMTVGAIASKAVLAGIISLVISGFIATKNHLETTKSKSGAAATHSWDVQTPPYWNNPYPKYHPGSFSAGPDGETAPHPT